MTKLLEDVIDKVSKLPDNLQQVIAKKLMEYYNELKWDELLDSSRSHEYLDKIENNILNDIHTKEYDNIDLD